MTVDMPTTHIPRHSGKICHRGEDVFFLVQELAPAVPCFPGMGNQAGGIAHYPKLPGQFIRVKLSSESRKQSHGERAALMPLFLAAAAPRFS